MPAVPQLTPPRRGRLLGSGSGPFAGDLAACSVLSVRPVFRLKGALCALCGEAVAVSVYTPQMAKSKSSASLQIRPGTRRDIPEIVALIRGLAKYERLTRHCRADARRLRRDGFDKHRYFETLICRHKADTIGVAVYYFAYSTFSSSPVLFIEDIFVLAPERGLGAGTALMKSLARVAVKKRCMQMEWIVLDWNRPAIRFYSRLGARLDRTWVLTRLSGEKLRRLAQRK
jgi:GNAT superfamily N-acetyltransferase